MPKPDLRATLEAATSGTTPLPRGNVVTDRDLQACGDFASACHRLCADSLRYQADRIPAPSELLPLLP